MPMATRILPAKSLLSVVPARAQPWWQQIGLAVVLSALPMSWAIAAPSAADHCAQLLGLTIAAADIGLPTQGAVISSASMSQPEDPNGDYCKIEGAIRPVDPNASNIRFRVNLPTTWNHKAVHIGGGGYDGTLVDGLTGTFLGKDGGLPVKRGFVTFGSDAGHVAAQASQRGGMAAFALNDEELDNFAGAQLKKVHDVVMVVMRRHYGSAPRRMYFTGNSQGGHEALTVAQRWPKDYDGVVAVHPAYDFVALQLSGLHVAQALYRTPGAWLSPDKISMLAAAVLRTCDALDGVRDGLISNLAGCRAAFQPQSLRCPSGNDEGPQCLSDEQLATVHVFDSAYDLAFTLQDGVRGFSRWPMLQGAYGPSSARLFSLGTKPAAATPPTMSDAFLYVMADQMVRFMVMRDPHYDSLQFDPSQHIEQLQALSRIIEANSPNLDTFRKRGGKLLMMHGTVDSAIATGNSVAYYDSLVDRYGIAELHKFARFYLVPGFGHGDGPFQVSWDSLTTLDDWVDHHREPINQMVVDTAMPTAGRSRPLCEYPSWPQYQGSGDVNNAQSFRCVTH